MRKKEIKNYIDTYVCGYTYLVLATFSPANLGVLRPVQYTLPLINVSGKKIVSFHFMFTLYTIILIQAV